MSQQRSFVNYTEQAAASSLLSLGRAPSPNHESAGRPTKRQRVDHVPTFRPHYFPCTIQPPHLRSMFSPAIDYRGPPTRYAALQMMTVHPRLQSSRHYAVDHSARQPLNTQPPLVRIPRTITSAAAESTGRAVTVSPVSVETQHTTEDFVPTAADVLVGTGRTNSAHPGNRKFHQEIYNMCPDYFDADYKKGVVDRAIQTVYKSGGRFLEKGKKKGEWHEVTDMDRLERNTRKSFHMAKKQREKDPLLEAEPRRVEKPVSLVGSRIAIFHKHTQAYHRATIDIEARGQYFVVYDDQRLEHHWIDLRRVDYHHLTR